MLAAMLAICADVRQLPDAHIFRIRRNAQANDFRRARCNRHRDAPRLHGRIRRRRYALHNPADGRAQDTALCQRLRQGTAPIVIQMRHQCQHRLFLRRTAADPRQRLPLRHALPLDYIQRVHHAADHCRDGRFLRVADRPCDTDCTADVPLLHAHCRHFHWLMAQEESRAHGGGRRQHCQQLQHLLFPHRFTPPYAEKHFRAV